jgi:FkbM family methyltransferase
MTLMVLIKKMIKRFKAFKNHPLTKKDVLGAIYRYVAFNIIQLFFPHPKIHNWIGGLKFYAQKGDAGVVANIYFKLYDYEDSMFLIKHLSQNELFVDIGANVGHFSLLAAGVSKANVIAFEPIPKTFLKFNRNIELNNLSKRINSFNYGVGNEDTFLNFTTNRDVMNKVIFKYDENSTSIKVVKLDDFLINENPTFLKIDVEGFEYNVLSGGFKILSKKSLKYIIIELNSSGKEYGYSNEDIFNILINFNFIPIEYDVELNLMKKINTYNKNKFNTIFVKKELLNA